MKYVKVIAWVRDIWLRNFVCEQYFAGFSSPLKIENVKKPHIRFVHRYAVLFMKDYVCKVCYRPRIALKKNNKRVIAHLLVFIHGMAITRRVKAKSTYSSGAV